MDNDQIKTFFHILRRLRFSLGLNPHAQCRIWLELYDSLSSDTPSHWLARPDLPKLLALVHPDFYKNSLGNDISESLVIKHSKRNYSKRRFDSHCKIDVLIPEAVCPYWHQGLRLRNDHIWPHSLGGATAVDNRLSICQTCNEQKSNSPLLFPGKVIPIWLKNRVSKLHQLKTQNFM